MCKSDNHSLHTYITRWKFIQKLLKITFEMHQSQIEKKVTVEALSKGVVVLQNVFIRRWALKHVNRVDCIWIPGYHSEEIFVLQSIVRHKLANTGRILKHVAVAAQETKPKTICWSCQYAKVRLGQLSFSLESEAVLESVSKSSGIFCAQWLNTKKIHPF
jgi:hypothetical protein